MTADIAAMPHDGLLFYYEKVQEEIETDRGAKYPVAVLLHGRMPKRCGPKSNTRV